VSAAIEPSLRAAGVNQTVAGNGAAVHGCFTVHGTSIALRFRGAGWGGGAGDWVAVLIRGASGAGKSDLALRCLAQAGTTLLGAAEVRLVADDQTLIQPDGSTWSARAPAPIAGLLEVRGLGLLTVPHAPRARLILVADLAAPAEIPRYPAHRSVTLSPPGQRPRLELPHLLVTPFEPSSPLKLLLALQRTAHGGQPVGADAPIPHCLPEGQ
jgi:HPr kinase/phosphorylase